MAPHDGFRDPLRSAFKLHEKRGQIHCDDRVEVELRPRSELVHVFHFWGHYDPLITKCFTKGMCDEIQTLPDGAISCGTGSGND